MATLLESKLDVVALLLWIHPRRFSPHHYTVLHQEKPVLHNVPQPVELLSLWFIFILRLVLVCGTGTAVSGGSDDIGREMLPYSLKD